jgi:hypothetical protein
VQLVSYFWIPTLLSLAGLSFGIYPEIAIIILLTGSLIAFFQTQTGFVFKLAGLKGLYSIFALFFLLRIILAWRILDPWQGLLEGVAAILMIFISFWLDQVKHHLKIFTFTIFLILALITALNIVPRLIFAFQGGTLQWVSDRSLVRETKIGDVYVFQAIIPNAWVLQNTIMQGSGRIRYQVEVRAKQPFQTSIGFIQSSLPNGRTDRPCLVKINWGWCSLEVNLSARDWTQVGIGGFGTWNPNSPALEIRDSKIIILEPPNVFAVLTDSSRVAGFSFNFNAFGAQVAVVGLLAIIFAPNLLWIFLATAPTVMCIFLSGSRGSLAAFTVGLLVLFVVRTRYHKILPWLLGLVLIGMATLQAVTIRSLPTPAIQSQSGLRSLNVVDQDSARGRLEIWRLATKVWLENPRTFLIGTGDLLSAMKVKFDTRSSQSSLSKVDLTHAHNLWIQTAGESGLLGLIVMLWLWGWVILKAWRSRDAGALALLITIFIINSVDYLFFYAPVHLAFWMAAAGLKPLVEPKLLKPEKPVLLT